MTDIVRDTEVETRILEMMRAKSNTEELERVKDIHVSDLLYPREAVLKRKLGHRISDTLMLTFIAGKGHHLLVQECLKTKERPVKYEGVIGSEDIELDGVTHEFKSTRTYTLYSPTDLPEAYPAQLRYYLAMEYPDKTEAEGCIDVLYLVYRVEGRTKPTLRCYRARFDDLDKAREEIKTIKAGIEAVLNGEAKLNTLPLCIGCSKFKHKDCAYLEECNPFDR